MVYQNLLVGRDGAVWRIKLNRPEVRNALNAVLLQELCQVLEEANADSQLRVIILEGAGGHFCAGRDLNEMLAGDSVLELRSSMDMVARVLETMARTGPLIVAKVRGYALAGGFGLVAAADLAVASEDAVFGLPEIHRGLFPMTVMAAIARHLSPKQAVELMFLGGRLGAAEAYRLGLINRVVPSSELDEAVDGLAREIAAKSPAVLRLGKEAFYTMSGMEYFQSLRYLREMITLTALTADAAEGVRAFLERREPQWKGC
jgi:enoyl-CoA hydratase/carnithine racemase